MKLIGPSIQQRCESLVHVAAQGGLQRVEGVIHLLLHGCTQRRHGLVYALADSRMRSVEHLIHIEFQALAYWLDHEISLLTGNE